MYIYIYDRTYCLPFASPPSTCPSTLAGWPSNAFFFGSIYIHTNIYVYVHTYATLLNMCTHVLSDVCPTPLSPFFFLEYIYTYRFLSICTYVCYPPQHVCPSFVRCLPNATFFFEYIYTYKFLYICTYICYPPQHVYPRLVG